MGGGQQSQTTSASQTVQASAVQSKPAPSTFSPKDPALEAAVRNADRGPCKTAPDAGCHLDEHERATLVAIFRSYVGQVSSRSHEALSQLATEISIKNTDEVPWYVNIILAAVAAAVTEGLSLAIGAGAGVAGRALAGAARVGATVSETLPAEVSRMISVVALEVPAPAVSAAPQIVASKAVDAGVGFVKPALAHSVSEGSDAQKQKEQDTSYVGYLGKVASIAYKKLMLEAPSKLNDIDLQALCEQFDPVLDQNQTQAFVARFRASLAAFDKSTVSKIGRRTTWDEKRGHGKYEIETRVAWLVTRGAGKRLIYVDRAFSAWFQEQKDHAPSWSGTSRSPAYDSGRNQLSLQQDADWHGPLGDARRHEVPLGPDMMINYVEPEFVDLALQMQHDVWLSSPETFMLDYSYAPPKMIKVAGS